MRLILIALCILFSVPAFAQMRCLDKLLPIPRLSASHQLTDAEWNAGDSDILIPEMAQRAVNALVFGKLLCRENEISFSVEAVCNAIDPQVPESTTCYYSSNLGYFILTQDTTKNANIIFHRIRSTRL